MTTAKTDLMQLAEIALKMARHSLKTTKAAGLIIVVQHADGAIEQVPDDVSDHLGDRLLNSGRGKDLLFGVIRDYVQARGITAVVFATEAWQGKGTEKSRDIPEAEFRRLSREHDFDTLVQLGLVRRTEAIVVTAQDSEQVLVLSQEFTRDASGNATLLGEVEGYPVPQKGFRGRQKMYGDLREEKLS